MPAFTENTGKMLGNERGPITYKFNYADIAQLVEQRIENPCVTGSTPVIATSLG